MDSKNHADISFLVCFVPYVYRQPFIFSTYCKIAHVHDDFHLFCFIMPYISEREFVITRNISSHYYMYDYIH